MIYGVRDLLLYTAKDMGDGHFYSDDGEVSWDQELQRAEAYLLLPRQPLWGAPSVGVLVGHHCYRCSQ